jgi:hypothetical protein
MLATTIPILDAQTQKPVGILTPMSEKPLGLREIKYLVEANGYNWWQTRVDWANVRSQSITFPPNGQMIENIISIELPENYVDVDNPVQPLRVISIFADHKFNDLEIRHAVEQEGFSSLEYCYSVEVYDHSAEHEF